MVSTRSHRAACVEAINVFRRNHGLLPIAVCSRTADYELIGTKLRLRTALIIRRLTKQQVESYLNRAGEALAAVRVAVRDSGLLELLETPLMLWVAMLAYHNAAIVAHDDRGLLQERSQLFSLFVDTMLQRRRGESLYRIEGTVHWLSGLAAVLSWNNQMVFYPAEARPRALPAWNAHWRRKKRLAHVATAAPQAGLPKQHQAIQGFFSDRSHKSFGLTCSCLTSLKSS